MKIRNMKQVKQVTAHMKDVKMKRLFRRNQIIITTLAVMIAAAGYLNYAGKRDLAGAGSVYEAGAMDISDEELLAENEAAGGELLEIGSLDQDLDQIEEALPQEELARGDAGQQAQTAAEEQPVPDQSSQQTAADSAQQQADGDAGQLAKADTPAASDGTDAAGASLAGIENPGEAVLTSGMSVADYIANVQLSREQVRAKNKETLMGLINSTAIDEAAKQQAIQDMIKLTEVSEKENAAETLLMAKGFADPVVSIADEKVDVVINAPSITDPQRAQIEDIVKRKAEVGADQIIITLLNMDE